MRRCVVLAILAACGKREPAPRDTAPPPPAPGSAAAACEALPFAVSSPVPEASGAAWLAIDGRLALVVVGDSGNHGAYAVIDPDTGKTGEQGTLPLGGGSDDLEGLAARGGRLYGLSSAGWIRVWQRAGKGFELVDGPYPLGPVDLPLKGVHHGKRPPHGDGMVCPLEGSNCGRNYEGLALAPTPNGCTGFAAAKADGRLYCLVEQSGRLAVDHGPSIAITRPGALADVAFSDDGTLWAGSNVFDLSNVYRIDDWADPTHATVTSLGPLGVGFPEVIAARGDVLYRMSDTGGSPSLMAKFRCRSSAR